jgi:hypothetical protein
MQRVDLTLSSMSLVPPARFGSVPQPKTELSPALTLKRQNQDEMNVISEADGIDTAASSS